MDKLSPNENAAGLPFNQVYPEREFPAHCSNKLMRLLTNFFIPHLITWAVCGSALQRRKYFGSLVCWEGHRLG